MPARSFLEAFPREIRDQIYTFVLASSDGAVTLSPWNAGVERSLFLLRTCKQIHRECKAIIWQHNKLTIGKRSHTELAAHWKVSSNYHQVIEDMTISLELLDRDELEWIRSGLPSLVGWESLQTVTISAHSEKPSSVKEFEALLRLRGGGRVDGRQYYEDIWLNCVDLEISTIWPPFAHWGKHKWLRQMLMDPTDLDGLLMEMHKMVGGELWVDGQLYIKDGQVIGTSKLDPRDGEIRLVMAPEGK